MITALCGGVGGSKLALGLYRVLPAGELSVVVNTADDLTFCGLHVSPDLDTVTYTLAGIAQKEFGWGIEGDTHRALEMLGRYGAPTWFRVGDRDLATHIVRTAALREGTRLTEVTARIAGSLGIGARVLPMTDVPVATQLLAGDEWIEFQEYFVHRRYQVPIREVRYAGIEAADSTPEVREAIREADVTVIVNSNPIVSILPILSVPGVRRALAGRRSPCVAVSPFVGGEAVSGPAGALMRTLGLPATASGLAELYRDIIDGLIIDRQDAAQTAAIEATGARVLCTNTIMRSEGDRERLASEVLAFAGTLKPPS